MTRSSRTVANTQAARLVLAAALGVSLLAPIASHAQPSQQRQPATPASNWNAVATRLGQTQPGTVELRAQRAWGWREGTLQRIALEGDVRLTIAGAPFAARRATLWIEPHAVPVTGAPPAIAYRVVAYLSEVFDPSAAAGTSFTGEALLVSGVVTGSPRLAADLIRDTKPTDRDIRTMLDAANQRLARFAAGDRASLPTPRARPRLDLREGTVVADPLPTEQAADDTLIAVGPGIIQRPARGPTPTDSSTVPGTPLPPSPIIPLGDPMAEIAGASAEGIPTELSDPRTYTLPPAERPAPQTGAIQGGGDVAVFAPEAELVLAGTTPTGEPTPVSLVIAGGIVVQYTSRPTAIDTTGQPVQLSATRAVVFFNEGFDPSRFEYSIDDIAGVYLEGNVAVTDGRSTLRGTRVYYDLATEQAIVLDAVFWTADEATGMPLYVRAREIRQLSRREWAGDDVRLSNVAFAEPHFAIGAREVRVQTVPGTRGGERVSVDARGVSFRAAELPLFAVPRVRGEMRPAPLRALSFENVAGDNVIRSEWDLYTILGLEAATNNRADLIIDGYLERGIGLGTNLEWSRADLDGALFAYYIRDNGEDELTSGATIDQDNEDRGIILAEQYWRLTDQWDLFLELAYLSDETFLDAFFEREAETRRELNTGLYLRRVEGTDAFTFEIRQSLNDFISNEYLLQSQGYKTDTLPDVAVHTIGRDLFNGAASYFASARLSVLDLTYSEPRMSDLGFNTIDRARAAFGILPNQRIIDELRADGYPSREVTRFDTRHEIEVPLAVGPINFVPFATGRFTAYDAGFDEFSNNFGDGDDDQTRLWGSVGVRASTSIIRVDDSVRSRFFDLDRIRHIIEPSVTVWHAATTRDADTLPIFNDEVEGIVEGTAARFGIRNTWQTMRGPAGRQRSVDWLVLDTAYITTSNETDQRSPFARWSDARPERSSLGEFAIVDGVMRMTEAVALTGGLLFDTGQGEFARSTFGTLLDHGEGFRSFVEYRELHAIDATLLNFGAAYELTRKYAAVLDATWDLDESEFQDVNARITRRFPQWTVEVGISVDGITDRFGIGISLRPVGFGGETRDRIFTADPESVEAGLATNANAPDTMRIQRGRLTTGPFE